MRFGGADPSVVSSGGNYYPRVLDAATLRIRQEIALIESARARFGVQGPGTVDATVAAVRSDIRQNETVGTGPLHGLGEIPMATQHVILGVSSFAVGALVMHLLHRYKVMR